MTIAYFCVLIAVVLPMVWAGVAKNGLMKSGGYDNSAPRIQMESLTGAAQRANWAQANAYEALPGFIAGVIIASLGNADQSTIDILAVVHVVARVAHGVLYIKDLASARSMVWVAGYLSMIGLFIAAF